MMKILKMAENFKLNFIIIYYLVIIIYKAKNNINNIL